MRKAILGLVAVLAMTQVAMADRVGGSGCRSMSVLAGDTDVYQMSFYGGERATVTVHGDGDTDLDLYIYDESGNLIGSDTDYTDQCLVSFRPRWTGSFTIRVVNRGHVYNNYTICAQ